MKRMVQIEINSDLRTEIAVHYTETRWRHQGLCELLDSDRMAQIIANKLSSSSVGRWNNFYAVWYFQSIHESYSHSSHKYHKTMRSKHDS